MRRIIVFVAISLLACSPHVFAQHEHMMHRDMPITGSDAQQKVVAAPQPLPAMRMHGFYGSYPMGRDSSGTSWQPDSSPIEGIHIMKDDWMFMVHGFATAVYTDQGGPRGSEKFFSSNMIAFMAERFIGPSTFGLRSMFSLEPLTIGKKGYPLLLQTGETANGQTPLIDRQHPHDLFMELAATYSYAFNDDQSVFAYFGLPGEPALGPPVFMHRFSGADIPEAPIAHHWLDSTHITFGVVTAGYIWRTFKFEGSVFNGREPDENRMDFESPLFNSFSGRVSYNPSQDWAVQASYGHIHSPEALHADINTDRYTFSVMYNRIFAGTVWQTTLAYGMNANMPGRDLSAVLLESTALIRNTHTIFGRIETVEKDELFQEDSPLADKVFTVTKLEIGYIFNLPVWKRMLWGIGASGSACFLPGTLQEYYDDLPLSWLVFARMKLS